ncbi:MAG: bifunctional UDP-N-acetylglucosamine diphosphorylase/glucosamine-1-phosphate N-acetyltransferase GlmU [Chloroflexi bacterium]|nr:bifunctional UDP-N-acetylglucosamine diphosphorylase/glucosamine-1-phosphate N-acetyltransferase GlmU [Chloroflexota bacterium]
MKSRIPKVLHKLAGRPMVRYILEAAETLKPSVVAIVVGREAGLVRAELGDSAMLVEQSERLGTADAVRVARPVLEGACEDVMVLYADTPLLRASTIQELLGIHRQSGALITLLTTVMPEPRGYGRIKRDSLGRMCGIIEQVEIAGAEEEIHEINVGAYCFRSGWLWPHLSRVRLSEKGEYYLTDLVAMAVAEYEAAGGSRAYPLQTLCAEDAVETMGINDRRQLAKAGLEMQRRINESLMLQGVTIIDPASTYINAGVQIGRDTIIYPNTTVEGKTVIGEECGIGPNSHLIDCIIGDRCRVWSSAVEGSRLSPGATVGPFSHLRAGSAIGEDAHIGNFAEVKSSSLGAGTRMGHFSYVGDAEVGCDVNIGAGTVTCNYDGNAKHQTVIGDGAFIGSDTMLVAPVKVGSQGKTGAGSVVTHDVADGAVVYGVPARAKKSERKERAQLRLEEE